MSSSSEKFRKSNYHTHSRWCDGRGEVREYIEAALNRGLEAVGFSGHAPLPYPNEWTMSDTDLPAYLQELRSLREEYRDRIEIYSGLETDYIAGVITPDHFSGNEELGLDYTIGSVHGLIHPGDGRYLSVDGPEDELLALMDRTGFGSPRAVMEAYYQAVGDMADGGGFTFLGHFDLIRKLNGKLSLFDEQAEWYRALVDKALDRIAAAAIPMEMNTGALSRGYADDPYPSSWILPRCRERGIPMIINSDAHRPEWIDHGFDLCRGKLKDAGYGSTLMLLQERWQEVEL